MQRELILEKFESYGAVLVLIRSQNQPGRGVRREVERRRRYSSRDSSSVGHGGGGGGGGGGGRSPVAAGSPGSNVPQLDGREESQKRLEWKGVC